MNTCCATPTSTAANGRSNTSNTAVGATPRTSAKHYRPHVDVLENDREFRIVADVPGATSESIELDLNQGVLTITANVPPREKSGAQWLRREYGVGGYRRTFHLGDAIDTSAIDAELSNGVLTVRLPKTAAKQARKIEVRNN